MAKHVTIMLDEPIQGHGPDITKLVYRPPVLRDILKVGTPYSIHSPKDGLPFLVEDHEAVAHYAEVCLVEPAEFSLVEGQVGVSDSLKVVDTVIGFFLDRSAGAAVTSATSPPTSS